MQENQANARAYVRNLPFSATQEDLAEFFEQACPVVEATVITDRDTHRSRGFGFVQFHSSEDLRKAIEALDGKTMGGREVRVEQARERR